MRGGRVRYWTVVALMMVFLCVAHSPAQAQATAAPTAARKHIKLGVSGRPDQASLEIALRRGYFEQQGLDVETVQAASGQEMIPALASNQLQAASGSPNAGLFNALNRGFDIRIAGDFAHIGDATDRTIAIMVRADLIESGEIKTVADMKGKVASQGPGPGQISAIVYQKLFDQAKLAVSDVTIKSINFPDTLAAFASKTIDVAYMIEPLVTEAERQNLARVMVPGGAIDPGAELSIWMFSPEFAKEKDAATRFMVAFLKGARDYYDAFFLGKDKESTIALLTKYLPVKDPTLWGKSRQFTDLNGRVNVEDLKSQAAFQVQHGNVTGAVPDIQKYLSPEFAEAAVKELGERK
jgi:NitT/TauT family transport system substrate-binding protein